MMRGQGWRTLRQRTAVFRSMRRARARAGRQTSSRKAAALCRQTGLHISTLSNMVHGRNRWTERAMRLLGLEHVRIVERADAEPVAMAVVRQARTYKPMWRLGDWPSRYRAADVVER